MNETWQVGCRCIVYFKNCRTAEVSTNNLISDVLDIRFFYCNTQPHGHIMNP